MARTTKGKANVLTEEEFKILTKITSLGRYALRDSLLVLFSYGLGLRAIEMAGLKVKDVLNDDLEPREVLKLQITKGNKPRELYLTDPRIRKGIADYVNWRISRAIKKREIFSREQPFFVSQKGCSFSNITMAMLFKNLYKQAGIIGSSHSGRRTFATNLIESGADIKSTQILMGHAHIQQTAQYVEGNPHRMKKLIMNALY